MRDDEHIAEILKLMEVPNRAGVYILGCFGRYITLYSQQVRALNLIYALHKSGRLSKNSAIAIVGAGASGLTAAVAAGRIGASVTVLERLPGPMQLQKASTQRFLHPHIYDWPKQEREGEATGLPFFDWTAAPADEVVEQIEREWKKELKRARGKITPRWNVTDVAIEASNSSNDSESGITLTWNDPNDGPLDGQFHLVILAIGFGLEQDKDGSQYRYWENDRLDKIDGNKKVCLISGYGDGGLTDLMRLCLRNFRHDLIVRLFAHDPMSREIGEELLRQEQLHGSKSVGALSDFYRELKVEHVLKLLKEELRTDTEVYLSGRRLREVFAPKSSILNRFIVSQLRRLKAWKWLPGPLYKLPMRTSDNKYIVKLGEQGERERTFDILVIRHGPEPALRSGFPDIWEAAKPLAQRWKELPQYQDPTRVPLSAWSDYFQFAETVDVRNQRRTEPYRLVAFDLDGTLLHGQRFVWSWPLVWRFLKYEDSIRKELMNEYVMEKQHTHKEWYKEWCDRSAALFRIRNLHRSHFKEITKELKVVEGFRETIEILKQNGLKLAIISGGIDVFLEEKIPDYLQLFENDVYINKFEFNDEGVFTGINSTPYDFEGKWKAVEEICKRESISPEHAVFVGDGFNDEHVIGKVGLTIAFAPTGSLMSQNADALVEKPDLREILPHILDQASARSVSIAAKAATPKSE